METIEVSQEQFDNPLNTPENIAEGIDYASKKRRKRRAARKARKKVKRTARKKRVSAAKKRIKTKVQKAGSKAMFAPLVPLKPVMIKVLNQKGKTVSRKIKMPELAKMFYNEIVVKSEPNFETLDYDFDFDSFVDPVTISALVSGIVTWIKGLRKKKAEGESLNKVEKTVVDGTEEVEKEIQEQVQKEAARSVGETILYDKKFQIIIGVILAAAIGFTIYKVAKK